MEVIIRPTESDAEGLVARLMAEAIRSKPSIVLGLAAGRTMENVYKQLVEIHRNEGLDFSLIRTFNLDEYIELPPENQNSYRHYMNHHFFDHVNIDPRNAFLPDGMAKDVDAACMQYEQTIREGGGIDLQLLGIGRAGHIGFNEPLSALKSRTRAKALTPLTIEENSSLFEKPEDMPRRAITMGVGAVIGGEGGSGGVIYPAVHSCRDSFSGMALVLEMMAVRKQSIAGILGGIPRYYCAGAKVPCSSMHAVEIIRKLTAKYADANPITTDGLRLDWDDGWVLIRASNTEPIMRVSAEALDQEKADERVAQFAAEIGA